MDVLSQSATATTSQPQAQRANAVPPVPPPGQPQPNTSGSTTDTNSTNAQNQSVPPQAPTHPFPGGISPFFMVPPPFMGAPPPPFMGTLPPFMGGAPPVPPVFTPAKGAIPVGLKLSKHGGQGGVLTTKGWAEMGNVLGAAPGTGEIKLKNVVER